MNYKKVACSTLIGFAFWVTAGDYSNRVDVDEFVATMVNEHGFETSTVRAVLDQAVYQQGIIDAITRPAEKKPWISYRAIFVTPKRIEDGVQFARENWTTLQSAEEEFGVPIEIIVAIIGVETNYGRNMGSYRVLDALTTLGFDYPPRAKFFRGQLEEFFILSCEERVEPFNADNACHREVAGGTLGTSVSIGDLVGSYAGAMGYGQFIPSSYRNFAIDYDGDGARDIWRNVVDAIGSVSAYFKDHGWDRGEPVIAQVGVRTDGDSIDELANSSLTPTKTVAEWKTLGIETQDNRGNAYASVFRFETEDATNYYLGYHNFYVITRYNISRLYAKAVVEVADGIAARL
ncbi:MAG: lytic murein transglycosylase [Gammaproteobacteria bacterium]|nr:lytic murein transglycosylase [Gammaproteobacteria bacterium]